MRIRALLVGAVIGAFVFLFPNPALADSGRHCTALGSCIQVWGAGVHVDKIQTSMDGCDVPIGAQNTDFRTHVFGTLSDGSAYDKYGASRYINWGAICNSDLSFSTWNPDRNFKNNSQLCSSLDRVDKNGNWVKWDVACIAIHT